MFPVGEEDIFLQDCMNHNLKGLFLPVTIGRHPTDTSSDRLKAFTRIHPDKRSGISSCKTEVMVPRMIAHALRYRDVNGNRKIFWYLRQWLSGISKARKNHVFDNYDSV